MYRLLTRPCTAHPLLLKTRRVACYDAGGAPLPATRCADLQRPPSQQACSGCTVSANSTDQVEGSSGGGGGNTAVIVAACSVGAAMAVGVAVGAFLLVRRRRQRPAAGQQAPPQHGGGKGSSSEEEGIEGCIPLPKQLPPIATGRGRARGASARASPRAHVAAAAGGAGAAHQQHQQGGGCVAAAPAHLQGHAPEYHVVHMLSPRLPGKSVHTR